MYSNILSLLNFKIQEDERYTLLTVQGPFELRLYHRMVCAKVKIPGSFEESQKKGMNYLNDYLKGNNFKVDTIQNPGPFFQIKHQHDWEIGIILPAHLTSYTAPQPINRLVKICDIPPARTGALRFKGIYSSELFERRASDLKKWLDYKGMEANGPFRIMRMSSMPFVRNFEVHYNLL